MSVNRFIDSNIWLYALFEPSQDEQHKQQRAATLLAQDGPTCISEQVIAEVCANLLRRKVCGESARKHAARFAATHPGGVMPPAGRLQIADNSHSLESRWSPGTGYD